MAAIWVAVCAEAPIALQTAAATPLNKNFLITFLREESVIHNRRTTALRKRTQTWQWIRPTLVRPEAVLQTGIRSPDARQQGAAACVPTGL
jgi:predicted alpha-1,6-mannanase (GH76 family)